MTKKKGSNASDTLSGGHSADQILGLGGSDQLSGRHGGDVISGGDGDDRISGGTGNDTLYGHSVADLRQGAGYISSTQIADIGQGAVQVTSAPGDDGFLYALNKTTGEITRINEKTGASSTFLNIPDSELSSDNEQGALGVAFDPDYKTTGRFFVYLTNADGNIEVREYQRNDNHPDKAVAQPVKTVLTINHPTYTNHNGGSMNFGPDGYLYIGTGDGGSLGDSAGTAQSVHSLLGKILRIDINGDDFPGNKEKNYAIPSDNPFAGSVDGRGEIWDTGVRNPWRFSFDSKTGDFYLGDVGQNSWEEVDYLKAGHAGGVNFGWNYREGYVSYTGTPPDPHAFTDPVHVYSHHGGNAAITGGYVYRGPGEGLHGAYFYSDFMNDKIYTLRMVNGKAVDTENRTSQIHGDQISRISSYGTDADGNMFAVSLDGGIYRITPGKSSGDGSDNIHGGSGQDSIYGGAGNDRLNGDDGSDRLDGGLGNDRMTGGKGPDTFVFKADMGHDTVTDFAANGTHHDRLDLSGLPGIHDFHDLMAHHLTVKGNDLLIESGDRHILLQDVHQSALSGHDFIF